jgi:hypothetical protein
LTSTNSTQGLIRIGGPQTNASMNSERRSAKNPLDACSNQSSDQGAVTLSTTNRVALDHASRTPRSVASFLTCAISSPESTEAFRLAITLPSHRTIDAHSVIDPLSLYSTASRGDSISLNSKWQ